MSSTSGRPEPPMGPFEEADISRNNFELLERMAAASGSPIVQGDTIYLKSKKEGEYFVVLAVNPPTEYLLTILADKDLIEPTSNKKAKK